MSSGLRIYPDSIAERQKNSTAFTGAYQKLGGPLLFASPLMKFVNNSNVDVFVSWDGVTDNDIIPAGGFALYDFSSDAGTIRGLFAPKNTQFWVKGAATATNSGIFYLVVFYTSEDL